MVGWLLVSRNVTPDLDTRYLRQLNIDKDILSMKNFNVYDPMKRGQGLTLDGQTLAHIEVWFHFSFRSALLTAPQ